MSVRQSEERAYFVGWIVVSEGNDSPRSSGVVLIACDAPQPHGHGLGWHFFWMDPSGVVRSGVHPHRMVTSLKRLDASTEEHFQQVQASDTLVNQLDHFLHQYLRLDVLSSSHFQWKKSLDMVECEVGKAGRPTWSCGVLAVEPGRLPTSN